MPAKSRPGHAPTVPATCWPGATLPSADSGSGKSTYMRDRSSSVAIGVPGVTSAPGLTWRMPSTPANGARMTRSPSCARTWATRARAASRAARWLSSCERAISCCRASSDWRWYRRSASLADAWASASEACCCCPESVTRTAPRPTSSPLSKWILCTISLTFAITVTDSRARAVPMASRLSLNGCLRTTAVVTAVASSPPRCGASPAPPQAASASTSISTAAGRRRRRRNACVSRDGAAGMAMGDLGLDRKQRSLASAAVARPCRWTLPVAVNRNGPGALPVAAHRAGIRRRGRCPRRRAGRAG